MATVDTVVKWCVYIASAGLLIRIGMVKPYTLQPFEVAILLATLLTIISWIITGMNNRWKTLVQVTIPWFLAIVVTLGIGTLLGFRTYPINAEALLATAKDFFFIGTLYCAFLLVRYYSNEQRFRTILTILLLMPIVWSVCLLIPQVALHAGFLSDQYTLVGLSGNQSILATSLLIPFGYCWYIFLTRKTSIAWRIVWYVGATISGALLIWTGSRGAWLSAAALVVFFLGLAYNQRTNWKHLLINILLMFCSAALSFIVLPRPSQIMALDRIFPSVTDYNPVPAKLETVSIKTAITTIADSTVEVSHTTEAPTQSIPERPLVPYQNRGPLWQQGIMLAMRNPFGLGPEYARISQALTEPDGRWVPAHNTVLQIFLSGGVGLGITLSFLFFVFIQTMRRNRKDKEYIMYASISCSMFMIMLFNDYLFTVPWIWIVLALGAGMRSLAVDDSLDVN